MEGTLRGDKFIVIFEHEAQSVYDEMEFQLWFFSGTVLDILKRDEGRYQWE